MSKARVPAVVGWFTLDADDPRLLGVGCAACSTVVFPPRTGPCPNPDCDGDLDASRPHPLSSRGTVWSYTNACYQPPPPFVARTDPYKPVTLAAVHLADEQLVVLGQMVDGVTVEDLSVGDQVRLTVDTLFEDDDAEHVVWKWAPA